MSLGRYLLGLALVATMLVPLVLAAQRVRARLVPTWSGALGLLADTVLTLGALLGIAQLLGAVGLFRDWAVPLACVLVGIVVLLVVRPAIDRVPEPGPPVSFTAGAAAAGAVALIAGQWVTWVAQALDYGVANSDSVWYGLPIAARFVQLGSITSPHFLNGEALVTYYPANVPLLHGLGMLAFRTDVLSPILNVVAAAITMLGGWCIGRRWRQGPAGVVAVCVTLTLTAMVGSGVMPGSAKDDVFAVAFLLAAVAFVVHTTDEQRGALVLAGIAAGLALGSKSTMVAVVAGLVVGVVVLTGRGRRRSALALLGGPLLLAGCFWYVRNLVAVGNPIPGLRFPSWLGIPDLYPPSYERYGSTLLEYIFDAARWREVFLPGFAYGWGRVAPVLVLGAAAGTIAVIARGRGLERAPAFVVGAGALAYLVTPGTAYAVDVLDTRGADRQAIVWLFGFNSRYVVPALGLGLVLLCAVHIRGWPRSPAPLLVSLLACMVLAQTGSTARDQNWLSDRVLGAAVPMALVVLTGCLAMWWHRRAGLPAAWRAGAAVVAALGVIAFAWPVARHYLDTRYAAVETDAFVRTHDDARYAVAGFPLQYPYYGEHLENHVQYVGEEEPDGSFHPFRSCLAYRRALRTEEYRFVAVPTDVVTPRQGYDLARWDIDLPTGEPPLPPPEARWSGRDPNETVAFAGAEVTIYRVEPGVTPRGCPRSASPRTRSSSRTEG